MNRLELETAVKGYLGRQNLSTTDLRLMIAIVEGELNRALKDHPRSMRRTYFTQAANDALLPLPADMMQAVTLRTDTGDYTQYPPTSRRIAQQLGRTFIARGDAFEVFPTPAVETVFYLDYIASLNPLTSDLDTNWVSVYFSDVYLYGILKEAAVYLKDDPRLAAWQGEFVRRTEELITQGWGQNLVTTPRIRSG